MGIEPTLVAWESCQHQPRQAVAIIRSKYINELLESGSI
jgi:hypothetical protein